MSKIFSAIKINNNSPKALLVHLAIMMVLLVIMVLLFFYVYLPYLTKHGQSITVPNLVGMNADELEDFLSSRDLKYEVTDSVYTTKHPPFAVIKQYPEEGFQVKEGRKISVTLNRKSPEMIKMPQLVGTSIKNAQLIANSHGLKLEQKYVPHKHHNLVLNQQFEGAEIKEGTQVYQGSTIVVEVGNVDLNEAFPVPDYVGQDIQSVEIAAKGQNVKIDVLDEENSTEAPGTVVRQRPEGGSDKTIRPGETITVWVVKEGDSL